MELIYKRLSGVPFILLLLMFAFANISTLYGSEVYWSGCILCVCLFAFSKFKHNKIKGEFDKNIIHSSSFQLFIFGSLVFILWALLNGFIFVNSQYSSIKYAIKYSLMSSIVVVVCFCNVSCDYYMKAMNRAFMLFFALIFIAFNLDFFSYMIMVSGDGRVGLSSAYPGVIYKLSMYLSLFFILLYAKTKNKYNLILCFLSGFIISTDGSRTALVWLLCLPVITVLISCLYKFKKIKLANYVLPILALYLGFASTPIIKESVFSNLSMESNGFYLDDRVDDCADIDINTLVDCDSEANKPLSVERAGSADLTRIEMYKIGLYQAMDNFPLGGGFMSTSIELPTGYKMVVHNLYLQLLGDLGLPGFLGYFLLFTPVFMTLFYTYKHRDEISDHEKVNTLAVASIVICYLFKALFHPLSSDITDLGFILISLAVLIKWNTKYDSRHF